MARILDGVALSAYLYRLNVSARQYAGLVWDCFTPVRAFSIDRKRGGQMLCSSNVIGPRPEQSAHSRLCGSTTGMNGVTARADEMIGALPGSR
jgi:hypothetical protein